MRVKKGKMNNCSVYYEQFNSISEFKNILEQRQQGAEKKIKEVFDDHSYNFLGVSSIKEAEDMLVYGWDKYKSTIEQKMQKEIVKMGEKKTKKIINCRCGFMPIVPNAIMGRPDSMLNMVQDKKKTKVLKFMINIDRAGAISAEDVIKKMSEIFGKIGWLETQKGYRCRIEIFATLCNGHNDGKTKVINSILLKSEDTLFNIKKLCFPVVHAAMLRLYEFAWEGSLNAVMPYDSYHCAGLGRSYEYWDEKDRKYLENNILKEKNEEIIAVNFRSNLDKILNQL